MKRKLNSIREDRISDTQKMLYRQLFNFISDLKRPKDARVAAEEKRQSVPQEILPLIF
ncbi:hypothetical protein D3C78_1990930 [compost metagenome]